MDVDKRGFGTKITRYNAKIRVYQRWFSVQVSNKSHKLFTLHF